MDKIRNLISQIKTFKLKDIKAIKNSSTPLKIEEFMQCH